MGQISSLHPRGRCRTRKEKNIRCCVAKLRGNLLVQVFPSETQNALPSLLGSPLGADELKLRTGEGQPEGADELFSLWENVATIGFCWVQSVSYGNTRTYLVLRDEIGFLRNLLIIKPSISPNTPGPFVRT